MKKKNLFLTAAGIAALVYLVFSVIVIGWTASCSVYSGIDFLHAVEIRNAGNVFSYVLYQYNNWQGTYSAAFFEGLLSPLVYGGLLQLRLIMVANAVLFFASLVFLLYSVFHPDTEDKKSLAMISVGGLVFLLLNVRAYPEIFTWFSAAASYSMPLSFTCLGLGCYLWANRNVHSVMNGLLALFFVFLAAGGSLVTAGTALCLYLVVAVYYRMKNGRLSGLCRTVVIAAFLFVLVNTLAPGNFIHHEQIADSTKPLGALVNSYTIVSQELTVFVRSPVFRTVFLTGLAIGSAVRIHHGDTLVRWGSLSVFAVFIAFVTVYPLALGYGTSMVPNRCYFVIDAILSMVILNGIMCIGAWLSYAVRRTRLRLSVVFLILLTVSTALNWKMFSTLLQYEDVRGILDDSYEKYQQEIFTIYETADHSDLNVVIASVPKAPDHINPFILSSNPENNLNKMIAEYYGIESIRLESDD